MTILRGQAFRNLTRALWIFLLGCGLSIFVLPVADAQPQSATAQAPQAPPADTSQNAPKPDTKSTNDEIVSRDSPATFKVSVNLVLVRVVVRDRNGKVITNLKKEDFQLADDRKPQIISSFSVETPASHVPMADSGEATSPEGTPVKAADLPQRFVTLFFDDLHLSIQDAMFSRQATAKLFAAMEAHDRFSIFTTSGEVQQDFTGDRGKLEEAVKQILPHSLAQNSLSGCPPMTLDEAFMIAAATDPTAMQVAIQDYFNCTGISPKDPGASQTAGNIVSAAANAVLNIAEAEEQRTYQTLQALARRMSVLPGQRVIVMMSPGFYLLPTLMPLAGDTVDRAAKKNVVINVIDARGLWVSSVYDASNASTTASVSPLKTISTMREEETHFTPLAELADGTGGTFFQNRNDIDQGILQAAREPEVSYVLGFAPQNLKLDGKYHNLKVTLVNKEKYALQARHGYFAPGGKSNPESVAKEEIQQAVFSQEELHELPVECQAQFFKGADGVHLSVVTHVRTDELKFRKVEERNQDTLTITTAIFDQNGNMLAGLQRVLDMRVKDGTLERMNKTGLNVKLNFDLQPGTFLVRTVVRDSEGAQMGATNRGVVIPQ